MRDGAAGPPDSELIFYFLDSFPSTISSSSLSFLVFVHSQFFKFYRFFSSLLGFPWTGFLVFHYPAGSLVFCKTGRLNPVTYGLMARPVRWLNQTSHTTGFRSNRSDWPVRGGFNNYGFKCDLQC